MQESPKNETSRPIKNASDILRSGQKFSVTHFFWGTILYPWLLNRGRWMQHWESIYFNSASALSHIKELVLVELECDSYQI